MNPELRRTELLCQTPFQPVIITFAGGERGVIEHSGKGAFDLKPGGATDFYADNGDD